MKAMVLAAGRGERMRPLTDTVPKPLLTVHGKPLIVHQIEALAKAGITDLVVNTGAMGKQISDYLGKGDRFDVHIQYSHEGDNPLETAGGIIKALQYLGDGPFIVTNADVYTDFDYANLPELIEMDAHIILVCNPSHNYDGDFALEQGKIVNRGEVKYTYSGIGVYSSKLFQNCPSGPYPLAPLLRQSAQAGHLSGELYEGMWTDVGTVERLRDINNSKI